MSYREPVGPTPHDIARESRARQHLPAKIVDPAFYDQLAALVDHHGSPVATLPDSPRRGTSAATFAAGRGGSERAEPTDTRRHSQQVPAPSTSGAPQAGASRLAPTPQRKADR